MTAARWQQIQSLFLAAAERTGPERAAFLTDACGPDPSLRSEVEALLRADERSGGGPDFIAATIGRAADDLATAARESRVGERVGPYRLVREIGHGGMGTVYLAERADEQYQASVAIKFVRSGAAAELERRFRAERQILAGLTHPNIAWLIDAGAAADGTPYLVMEYVAGEAIDRWCERKGLGLDGRLALFQQVCAGVQYAHQALVVHRDLKPSNILVTADGTPKLVDFGIAKLLAEGPDVEATGTLRLLTPAYGSPEQVRGGRITVATDVYSLGVVLYQLVTGRTPFDFTHASAAEIERLICDEPPPAPSASVTGPARTWRRRLAGDIDTIVLKAIRKEPERRYASVEQLAEDLRRHAAGRPVLARPDTVGYRAGKFVRRHRVGVAMSVAVVALSGFYVVRLADERDRARQEAAKAGEMAAFLQGLFEVSDPSQSRGATVTARELLDRGAQRIDTGLADQPEVQATMMRVIGEVYGSLGLTDQARPLLAGALERHRTVYGDVHNEVAASLLAQGVLLQNVGEAAAAESLFRRALSVRQQLWGRDDPRLGPMLGRLAYLVEGAGRYDEAEQLYRTALARNRELYAADDPNVAAVLVRLGGLLRRTDRLDDAEPILREAVAVQRRYYGSIHPRVASAVRNLAALRRDQGDYEEADTLYREAIATRRQLYGNDHPDVATTLHSYALLLQRKGDHPRALASFTEAVEMLERIHRGSHPNLAVGYYDLGTELRDQGRYDEATARFRQAIAMDDRYLAATHPDQGASRAGLASVYLAQGRHAQAEAMYREALARRRAALDPGHRYIGEALTDLGACLTGQQRYREAEATLLEAHALLLEGQGPDDSRTRRAAQRLVTLYEAWGRPEAAARFRTATVSPSPGGQ